jgi:hypothetical protein
MDVVTAPLPGRRMPRGLFGALVVFLISPFPALCLAAPLAARLLFARPRTGREWGWIAAAVFLIAAGLSAERTVARDLLIGYGLVFTTAWMTLMALRPGPIFPRTAVAAVDSATLIALLAWGLGIQWADVHRILEGQFRQQLSDAMALWSAPPSSGRDLEPVATWMASLYPGLTVLAAMAGGLLANAMAWHITGGRTGPEPGRFRDFRFNDHLVWGAIVTIGLVLAPLEPPWSVLAFNLLVVWAGVYGARGLAVTFTMLARFSLSLRLAIWVSAALLLPYAAGAIMLVGLADTWLDLRRTNRPPAQGVVP